MDRRFFAAVEEFAGTRKFTYITAVTLIRGEKEKWEQYPRFKEAMRGNPIRMISFAEMVKEVLEGLRTTVAPSDLARTLQLLKAACVQMSYGS